MIASERPSIFRLFYFSFFACLGIYLPYFNLYLTDLQFTGWQIGLMAAIPSFIKIFSTAAWGILSDRWQARRGLTIFGCFMSLLTFSFFIWFQNYWGMVLIMIVFSLFWSPTLPLVEATTLDLIEKRNWDYGRIRLWGSIGFILLSLGFGVFLDETSTKMILPGMLIFLGITLISSLFFPDGSKNGVEINLKLTGFLKRPDVIIFFSCCFLMQASHGTYYGFFSIVLKEIGYSKTLIGFLWSIGVFAEILVMAFAGKLMAKIGTLPLMTISLLFATLRWTICALTLSLIPLIFAQLLHAFSFGLFHVAAIMQIQQMVPRSLRASGQSIYSSVSYGMGIGFGLLFNGFLFKTLGPYPLFTFSALMALIAAGLILLLDHTQAQPVGEMSS